MVGRQGTQFGLATYSGFPVLGFPLDLYQRAEDVAAHLGRLEYSRYRLLSPPSPPLSPKSSLPFRGVTLTAEALRRTARELFTPRFVSCPQRAWRSEKRLLGLRESGSGRRTFCWC